MKVFAHRGAWKNSWENTVEACRDALKSGADAIEIDVRQTRDGRVVVHHNESTAQNGKTGPRKISGLSFSQIRKIRLHGKYRIPLLEDVLDTVRRKTLLIIELKSPGVAVLVAEILKRKRYTRNIAFTSFLFGELDAMITHFPRAHRIAAMERYSSKVPQERPYAISLSEKHLTPRVADKVKKAGFRLFAYTINDAVRARRMEKMGVDGIYSDDPETMRKALSQE